VWAWKESRVHTIINYVDKLFCILPFEKDFYKKYNYEVEFVGHPLLDIINENTVSYSRDEFIQRYNLPDKKFIAILPGSRQQEIQAILPIMTSICSYFKDYHFLIAGISRFPKELYTPFLKENSSIIYDDTYAILRFSEAGIIKSGTSTMEAALFNVPQVVCYRGGQLSYLIARLLVRNIQYISMVNLIMGKEVVKELIQNDFNEKNLRKELDQLLNDTSYRNRILNDYQIMRKTLGGAGASKKLAEKIYYSLKSENA
jgi:lipid-A-disaccharide synthase